jgi:hypothetical protein
MAKKPLGEPRAPRGGRDYEFFDLLQGLVRRHGDPSVATLANSAQVNCTRQVLHRALVGPALPSQIVVEEIVSALNCTDDEKEMVASALLFALESRVRAKRSMSSSSPGDKDIRTSNRAGREISDKQERERFAAYLSRMHDEAGNSGFQRLSQATKISTSTLSDWFRGKSLPAHRSNLEPLVQYLLRHGALGGPGRHVGDLVFDLYDRAKEADSR